MTKSELFKLAHNLARENLLKVGDYRIAFAFFLKQLNKDSKEMNNNDYKIERCDVDLLMNYANNRNDVRLALTLGAIELKIESIVDADTLQKFKKMEPAIWRKDRDALSAAIDLLPPAMRKQLVNLRAWCPEGGARGNVGPLGLKVKKFVNK